MSANKDYGRLLGDIYRKHVREYIKDDLHRQRFKLLYDVWSYYPLLSMKRLGLRERIRLLCRLLRIDWRVLHGHKPCEITPLLLELMNRPRRDKEVFIEAGCWNGGSTSKFSIVCKIFGYDLHVYDSFQGVQEWGFLYAATEADVRRNVEQYGEPSVCKFHPGWFKDTLLNQPMSLPVRMVYIDCDVPDGTKEVLSGVLPSLAEDGAIYTQDYHLRKVRDILDAPQTWREFGVEMPTIEHLVRNIARITWQVRTPKLD